MRILTVAAVMSAGSVTADPLDLIDYGLLFDQNADAVEVVNDTRSIVEVGEVTLIKDGDENATYTGVDQSGQAAVGCFVSVLATLEAAQQACNIVLTPEQTATQDSYRRVALVFYGRHVQPPTTLETVQARYAALVGSELEAVKPLCETPEDFTVFADRLFAPAARAEFEGMMSVPRLPVANPCF